MLLTSHPTQPFRIQLRPLEPMDRERLYQFCQLNPDLQIERTAQGALILMSPATPESGHQNAKLIQQIANWTDQDGTGIEFDSSAGFTLPNGAMRSPDVAWIRRERWNALTPEQRRGFAQICPDFVIELRSPSDSPQALQLKMREYIDTGCRLAWLIDPQTRTVSCYRPEAPVEILSDPTTVKGDPILPGLVLELSKIWTPLP